MDTIKLLAVSCLCLLAPVVPALAQAPKTVPTESNPAFEDWHFAGQVLLRSEMDDRDFDSSTQSLYLRGYDVRNEKIEKAFKVRYAGTVKNFGVTCYHWF